MKRHLARRLESVADFPDPTPRLEQYRTPAELAATLIHLAATRNDLADRTVVDLGTGTGMLAIAAAFADPVTVLGIDIDANALNVARENFARLDPPVEVHWIRGDGTRPPLDVSDATVVMNPPFGAQAGGRHADRDFLRTAAAIGAVSYSIHNEGSEGFVESFAADNGGRVTDAYQADFELPNQFTFHREESRTVEAEVFRIDWTDEDAD